jgi:hypothetical protein
MNNLIVKFKINIEVYQLIELVKESNNNKEKEVISKAIKIQTIPLSCRLFILKF